MDGKARIALLAALALFGSTAAAAPAPRLTVDRVILVMRHGVRPPTKAPAMPPSVTPETWPTWSVAPGWLTQHGAVAVTALGVGDRARFVATGVLPDAGCPAAGAVSIVADSDQRTLATARAWAAGLAPGCTIAMIARPEGEDDPLFSPPLTAPGFDPAAADAAVRAAIGPGGVAALDARYAALLRRLDAILCAQPSTSCGVAREPTGVTAAAPGQRPKLRGALDRASTAAQILLLEYAEGKPMAEVGWGRASAADVTALSQFHALEFRLLARPRAIARPNLAGIVARIADTLTAARAPMVTMFSGHDTQVANLGGLLDTHWQVPGFAADDPAPGGAIVIERLHDAGGRRYVRVRYRAQTLDQLRAGGAGAAFEQTLTIPGCGALCPAARFVALLTH